MLRKSVKSIDIAIPGQQVETSTPTLSDDHMYLTWVDGWIVLEKLTVAQLVNESPEF